MPALQARATPGPRLTQTARERQSSQVGREASSVASWGQELGTCSVSAPPSSDGGSSGGWGPPVVLPQGVEVRAGVGEAAGSESRSGTGTRKGTSRAQQSPWPAPESFQWQVVSCLETPPRCVLPENDTKVCLTWKGHQRVSCLETELCFRLATRLHSSERPLSRPGLSTRIVGLLGGTTERVTCETECQSEGVIAQWLRPSAPDSVSPASTTSHYGI